MLATATTSNMIPEWLPFNWVTISVVLFIIFYIHQTWNNNYWKKRNVTFVKPKLVFGNYKDVFFQRLSVGEVMEDLYKKLDGKPFVGFWRFRTPGLMIRDPEVVKAVLMKDFPSFQDNGIILDPNLDPLMSKNPFFRTGEEWKNTRSVLSPSFTSGKLKALLPLMQEVCEEFLVYLQNTSPSSYPDGFEMKSLSFQYTVEMVARCAFGIKANNFTDPNSNLKKMVRRIVSPGFWKNVEFMLMNFVPALGSLLQIRWMPSDVDLFFRKIVFDVIDYRKKNNVVRHDYLQYLLENTKKSLENGGRYTEDDALGHAVTFMTEGSETSSIALGFALYEMARHPDIQEALRKEVAAAKRENGGTLPFDAIMELPLLDRILQETLRLYAPLMAMEKMCTQDTVLRGPDGSQLHVDAGTHVVIPVRALHYDPRYYPNPERFDPDRWAPERRDERTNYTYLPFGEGPRICVGMRFAQLQVKLALANVVDRFEVKPTPKTPPRFVQDPTYFMTAAKGGVWARFEKRQNVN